MAIYKISHTHSIDAGINILRLLALLIWFIVIAAIISSISDATYFFGINNKNIQAIVIIAGIFGILLLAGVLHEKISLPFLNNLSAYLYVRKKLKTDITFSEVKEISFLFNVNSTDKWFPMTEVLNLPKEKRKEYIFNQAKAIFKELLKAAPNNSIQRTLPPSFGRRQSR